MHRLSRKGTVIGLALIILLIGTGVTLIVPSQRSQAAQAEPQALIQATGKITLLRAHDVGTGFGPPADFINVEVVIRLDSQPNQAMGFQLRDDGNRPARQAMLDLLRDAFNHNWTVTVDYELAPGDSNGVILRVWLTK